MQATGMWAATMVAWVPSWAAGPSSSFRAVQAAAGAGAQTMQVLCGLGQQPTCSAAPAASAAIQAPTDYAAPMGSQPQPPTSFNHRSFMHSRSYSIPALSISRQLRNCQGQGTGSVGGQLQGLRSFSQASLQLDPDLDRQRHSLIHGDKIHIRGARFYGYHGVLPAENAVGQPFVMDITLHCRSLMAAGHTDDLQHTVSYADAYTMAKEVVEGPPCALLETVVHRVAVKLLRAWPQHLLAVTVGINKCHIPALTAGVSSVGVEVTRTAKDLWWEACNERAKAE